MALIAPANNPSDQACSQRKGKTTKGGGRTQSREKGIGQTPGGDQEDPSLGNLITRKLVNVLFRG